EGPGPFRLFAAGQRVNPLLVALVVVHRLSLLSGPQGIPNAVKGWEQTVCLVYVAARAPWNVPAPASSVACHRHRGAHAGTIRGRGPRYRVRPGTSSPVRKEVSDEALGRDRGGGDACSRADSGSSWGLRPEGHALRGGGPSGARKNVPVHHRGLG